MVRKQTHRFNWLSAGRRWRKTTLAMSIAVEEAIRGKRILWGAPTYDQVRIGWDETMNSAEKLAEFNQGRMVARFPGGGSIIFRSMNVFGHAKGHTADGIVVDEVADVEEEAWYEVLRPMLVDTDGWGWFIGTPRGHNWFWREFQHTFDRMDSIAWQVPTVGCDIEDGRLVRKPHPLENPHISFKEILNAFETMPERVFRQEFMAEFIEDSGGVFRNVKRAVVLKPTLNEGERCVVGIDWGKYNDFTVFSVMGAESKTQIFQDRFNRIDYTVQVGRLKALCERFKPISILAERNAMGDPLIELLVRDGLPVKPFVTTNRSKALLMDYLTLAFERQEISILPNPQLIAELQAYEMSRLPSGMLRYSAPKGMYDDTVIALALTLWATRTRQQHFLRV